MAFTFSCRLSCFIALLLDNTSFSSHESGDKKSKRKDKSSGGQRTWKHHKHHENVKSKKNVKDYVSETEGSSEDDSDATKDGENSVKLNGSVDPKQRSNSSTLSAWLIKSSDSVSSASSVKKISTSNAPKPSSSSSAAQMLSKFASGTSIAKKQAEDRKRKARASNERISSEGEDDDEGDVLSSEFEDSSDELDYDGGMTDLQREMVSFFQDALIDELALISGCSVKKAQRIVELRPFDSWQSLVRERVSLNKTSK